MKQYLCKRAFNLIPISLAAIFLTLFLLRLVPGDPVDQILGEYASLSEKNTLRQQLGLNKSLYYQSISYVKKLFQGDLGFSLVYNKPVLGLILERFPATFKLAFFSLLLAILLGLPTGILASLYKGGFWDKALMTFSLLGVALPNFWLGPILILCFSIKLNLLPVSGYSSPAHYVLPVITMGTALMAVISRVTRNSLLLHMGADYVRTARAKGLGFLHILLTHVLKNSALPIITIVSLQFSVLLTGAVVTEVIFDWPGVGSLVLEALRNRDYPLVQGCVLFFCLSYGFISLLTDIIYVYADPRISYSHKG